MPQLDPRDVEEIEAHGLTAAEARRQLALLRDPPPRLRLLRPCTLADGIHRLPTALHEELESRHRQAAAAGRFHKLVPASGAASRMFRELAAVHHGTASEADRRQAQRLLTELDHLPFGELLAAALAARGVDDLPTPAAAAAALAALLDPDGLGYASLPKALIPFHRYPDGARTAFEEQLVEAVPYLRDAGGRCRVHFTVAREHRAAFEAHLEAVRDRWEEALDVRFSVTFSTQSPATDTLAADPAGGPFRDAAGRLVFRPGGHGALVANLADLDADLVFLRNIDNVPPQGRQPTVARWKRLLAGQLLRLAEAIHDTLRRLDDGEADGPWLDDALGFVARELCARRATELAGRPSAARRYLRRLLDRPLRVCGVVANRGEPGGGPFWVRQEDGTESLQIVERAEVADDPEQRALLAQATHFNPVDLVLALRRPDGTAYDLPRYRDPRAVLVTRKSYDDGRPLLALEHPGLWNGAMARWNTVFVEVPADTFTPVKTVFDLLRPEHRRGGGP